MAFSREFPTGFQEALKLTRKILSENSMLVQNDLVETESEQIVIGAYRAACGKSLSRMELFSRMKDPFPEEVGRQVLMMAVGRRDGKPLQYVLGYGVFFDHEYRVAPGVLVPRPETEVLVEIAAETLRQENPDPALGLEIGLGSGAISIELMTRFQSLSMVSSELTDAAAAIAQENAKHLLGVGASKLKIVRAADSKEVWPPFERFLQGRVNAAFIISNPPYLVPEDEIEVDVLAHEPPQALFAPEGDALYFYREIAVRGGSFLMPRGFAFLEIPHQRAVAIRSLFEQNGWEAEILPDLAQRERVLAARLK